MQTTRKNFKFGGHQLDLSIPQVMGILNLTPDSFSDGGELLNGALPNLSLVRERAEAMVAAGASILDIGGESTRPGATAVSSAEEMKRVLPVLDALQDMDVVLSIDTSNPELITASAQCGAGLINDVRALERAGALEALAATDLPVCLMHMQGQPESMQDAPVYKDVLSDVAQYLSGRAQVCVDAGIAHNRILLDPGFGFGKTLQHNLYLLKHLEQLQALGFPLLIGVSRKRMLGAITGKAEKERVVASVAAATIGVMKGACIVRTHDVDATMDAIKLCRELQALA